MVKSKAYIVNTPNEQTKKVNTYNKLVIGELKVCKAYWCSMPAEDSSKVMVSAQLGFKMLPEKEKNNI